MKSFLIIGLLLVGTVFAKTAAKEVQIIFEDSVYRVEKYDQGKKVFFNKQSGVFYLQKESKNYDSISLLLKKSQTNGESVKVRADSTSLKIKDVEKKI